MLNNFNELDRRRFITNLTLTTLGVSVIPSFAESLDKYRISWFVKYFEK